MAAGGEGEVSGLAIERLAHQSREGRAGADFEEELLRLLGSESDDGAVETHRLAEVFRPVERIGRFLRGEPLAGDGGKNRNVRTTQLDAGELGRELLDDGSIIREWKAWEVCRAWATTPSASSAARKVSRSSRGPATTQREGPFTAARSSVSADGEQVGLGQTHREHAASGQFAHEPAPRGKEAQSVLQRKDSGMTGGDKFTDAVTDHRGGFETPVTPEVGEGVFDHEDRGLGEDGVLQLLRGGFEVAAIGRVKDLGQAEPEMGRNNSEQRSIVSRKRGSLS